MRSGKAFWAGFFLVSLVLLLLETLITRIFSLILWHNLAYLVISLALLGIGAAGVWASIFQVREKRINPGWFSVLAGISLLLVFRVIGNLDFQWGWSGIFFLVLSSGLIFIPFFFLGMILIRVFSEQARAIGSVYAINLVGSGAGVMVALLVLKPLGMPRALILAGLALGVAGFLFSLGKSPGLKVISALWIIFSLSGFLWAERWYKFQVTTKSLGKFQEFWPDFKLEFSRWDPLGRVDAFSGSRSWLSYGDEKYFYRALTIDGAADTTLISFKEDLGKAAFFPGSEYGQGFLLFGKVPSRVLVIGVGGAPDVEAGLHFRSKKVIGVEVNGSVLEAVRRFLPEIANDPRVELVKSDGRSYVARTDQVFDIIQISGVDTISALEWGAYLQAENYVHTVEAYADYLKHLSPEGVLSIGLSEMHPPRNMLRSCVLVVEAMRRLGIDNPEEKILLTQQAQYIQLLARKKSFTAEELEGYRSRMDASSLKIPVNFEFRYLFNQRADLWIRYAPGRGKPDDDFVKFFQAVKAGREKDFVRNYAFDISAVTDDRPFFYKYYYWPFLSFSKEAFAGPILWAQFWEAVVFAGIFILLPLLWLRRSSAGSSPGPGGSQGGILRNIWFFFFIGLGYLMIEIPLIQRFALYLGHPTYALGLVLGVLLVFSGLGSFLSQKFFRGRSWLIWVAVAGIIGVNVLAMKLAPALVSETISRSFFSRALLTAAWAGLLGIFMGMPFPAGVSRLEQSSPGLIPWAWAVNISASVVSSILAVMLAMSLGFNLVSLIASGCYLLAGLSYFMLGAKAE